MRKLPKHIAFIVDGNRRWARKRGLPNIAGHKKVSDEIIEPLIYHCLKRKIPYLTFWAFSTENWKRGKVFAASLFMLLKKGLQRDMEKYIKAGMKLNMIGDLSKLPKDLVKELNYWKNKSRENKKLIVTFALNYGGRDEIIRAIKRATSKLKVKSLKLKVKDFSSFLDTHDLPDPDLIIRTGGSQRLSGFMLWQAEYSEFYFTDVLMPDFTTQELDKALKEYQRRQRRFGE